MGVQRRSFIATLGILIPAVSGGCVSSIRETVNPTTQLGWFGVHNADTDSPHRFDLEVKRDGEIVHSSSHRVEAAREFENGGQYNDGAVAECEWGSTPGDYTVRVRVDQTDWIEKSVTEFATSRNVDCVVADVRYRSTLNIDFKEGCDRDDFGQMCSFTN